MSGILVVSNDGIGLALTLSALHDAGYQASGASSFEEAKRFLAKTSPDLVIADECLGPFNGLHIIMRARAIHPEVSGDCHDPCEEPRSGGRRPQPERRVDAEAADAGGVAGADLQDAQGRADRRIGRGRRAASPGSLISTSRAFARTGTGREPEHDALRTSAAASGAAQWPEAPVWASLAMREMEADVACAVRCDLNVLITGETGVGKKSMARRIHLQSRRASGPLVVARSPRGPETSDAFDAALLEAFPDGSVLLENPEWLSPAMQSRLQQFVERSPIPRLADLPVDAGARCASSRPRAAISSSS